MLKELRFKERSPNLFPVLLISSFLGPKSEFPFIINSIITNKKDLPVMTDFRKLNGNYLFILSAASLKSMRTIRYPDWA